MKVLEVGTGNNQYSVILENAFHVDIDKTAFHVELYSDIQHLPFKDNSFDLIYVSHVLEHCLNPYQVLKELKRVTKKTVIIKVPNYGFYYGFFEDITHLYCFQPIVFFQLLSKVFDNVDVKTNFWVRKGKNKIKNIIIMFQIYILRLITRSNNELIGVCRK